MNTLDRLDAQRALAFFDVARDEFFDAFGRVPDAALRFRPEGDDYALSGLLIHVAGGLEAYSAVLAQIVSANWTALTVTGGPPSGDTQLTHDGISPEAREPTLARVTAAHQALADRLRALPAEDFERTAPVRFGPDADPLDTSASDILGWMRGHYREHVPHIAELVAKWSAASE